MDLNQIFILIGVGIIVGLSMSFVGYTGQGIVVPLVFLMTGDILLAISISLVNDFITASLVLIHYIRSNNYHLIKDNFLFIIISSAGAVTGVFLLMSTNISNSFGWLVPVIIIFLGLGIFKQGFPTSESVKRMIHNFIEKISKDKSKEEIEKIEEEMDEHIELESQVQPFLDPSSKLYYLLLIVFALIVGFGCGLFGIGGGLNTLLVLVIICGYPLKKGVGTAIILSIIMITINFTFFQIFGFFIRGQIYFDLSITLVLGISSALTGVIAAKYVQKLNPKIMGKIMGAIMILFSTITLIIVLLNY